MAGPTPLDYVTLGIAGVGAVTGVAALGATWAQFALSGPRLYVSHSTVLAGAPEPEWLVGVTVENRGRTAASVTSLSLVMQDGSERHIPIAAMVASRRAVGPALPCRLEPYTEETWWIKPWAVMQALLDANAGGSVRALAKVQRWRELCPQALRRCRSRPPPCRGNPEVFTRSPESPSEAAA